MTETIEITTEQINDLPLLLGLVEEMSIRQQIDAQIRPHGGWRGISVGTVVSIWLCHLFMERDHRLVAVRDWAAARRPTLDDLLGIRLRDTDLTDDRLANVLTMLSGPDDLAVVDQVLLADWLRIYALPQRTVRLDSVCERLSGSRPTRRPDPPRGEQGAPARPGAVQGHARQPGPLGPAPGLPGGAGAPLGRPALHPGL
jgi:hypothetical protein